MTAAQWATMVVDAAGAMTSVETETIVETPTRAPGAPVGKPRLPQGGEMLGRYTVLDTLGSGGMGVVVAAYDRELDRKVALKLLRTDKAGDGQRRMLREAKALALLQHEWVVTVFDVGTYEGQVYIAMEYVEGRTLDAWIAAESPRWPEILEIAIRAGRGLAAAHAAGLAHRDFKPANVLVGPVPTVGPRPVRVVDFGIAIATRGTGTEPPPDLGIDSLDGSDEVRISEHLTETGTVLGTPAYMAPEQHRGGQADALSDQFGFCVTLYRALYGERPFAGRTLAELRRNLLRGEPRPPPSASRVPAWLRRIVLRGLEIDPRRRWPSMAALLDALERAAAAHRRRPLVFAAVGGLALAGWAAAIDVTPPPGPRCDDATERLQGAWDDARREAVAVAFGRSALPYAPDTLVRLQDQLDAWGLEWSAAYTAACVSGRDGLRQDLDARMGCLRRRLAGVAALTEEFASADDAVIEHATMALAELPPIEECAEVAEPGAASRPPLSLEAEVETVRAGIVALDAAHSAGRFERARELGTDLLQRAEATGFLPVVAQSRWRLGMALMSLGRLEEAEQELTAATFDAIAAGDDESAARAATKLAFAVGYRMARHDEGLVWARHAEAAVERVGTGTLLEADYVVILGAILMSKGDFAGARDSFVRALGLRRRWLPEDHPHLAAVHNNLAGAMISLGQLDAGREHLERAIATWERVHGPEHPHVATALNGLGVVYERLGELEAARAIYERTLHIKERVFGPDHDAVAVTLDNLGSVLIALGEYDDARASSRRALAIRERALGPDHPYVASALVNLGLADEHQGRFEEAVAEQTRAARIFDTALGPEHPFVAHALTSLGRSLLALTRDDEAIAALERALRIREATEATALERAETRFALGRARDRVGAHEAARALVEAAAAEVATEATGERLREEIRAWQTATAAGG